MIQQCGEFWQQLLKVLHAILPGDQDDDGKGQLRQVLLKLEVSICGDEGVELRCCQRQKLAILDAGPSFISDGRHVMVKDQCRKVVWQ